MADKTKRRSRKSKLEPRECIEDFEVKPSNMQESQALRSILPKLKNQIEKEPMFDNESEPRQFSINIEVEEVEEAGNEINTNKEVGSEINMNETFGSEINMNETEQDYVQLESAHQWNKLLQCFIPEKFLREKTEELMTKTTSIIDKKIEIAIRHNWGKDLIKHVNEPQEELLQKALEKWRLWNSQSKFRGHIFMYKCYECMEGWWHLQEFRDHIKIHENINISLEPLYFECNLVAHIKPHVGDLEVRVTDKCWRCLKDAETHLKSKHTPNTYMYQCSGCKDKHHTCQSLLAHEGNCLRHHKMFYMNIVRYETDYECNLCNIKYLTQERYNEHLILSHSVRSDLPVVTQVKTCLACENVLWSAASHECPLRSYNFKCKHCYKKFQNKLFLTTHERYSNINHYCTVCGQHMYKQCMEIAHILRHSRNYCQVFKCTNCPNSLLFPNQQSLRQHKTIWHTKSFVNKRIWHNQIIVPKYLLRFIDIPKKVEFVGSLTPEHLKAALQGMDTSDLDETETQNSDEQNVDDTENSLTVNIKTEPSEEDDNRIVNDTNVDNNDSIDKALDNHDDDSNSNITIKTEPIEIKTEINNDDEYENQNSHDTDIVIKEENTDMTQEMTATELLYEVKEETMSDEEKQMEIEAEEIDELSKVFQASRQFKNFSDGVKLEIKSEEEEEDLDELDDIIILNSYQAVNQQQNTVNKDSLIKKLLQTIPNKQTVTNVPNFRTYKCAHCPFVGLYRQHRDHVKICALRKRRNVEKEVVGTVFMCSIKGCSDTFVNLEEFEQHVKSHEQDDVDLNKSDSKKSDTSEDFDQYTPEDRKKPEKQKQRVYSCALCTFEGSLKEYKQHSVRCNEDSDNRRRKNSFDPFNYSDEYKCKICDIIHSSWEEFLAHFPKHGLKRGQCPQCGFQYERMFELSPHVRKHIKHNFVKIQLIQRSSKYISSKLTGMQQCRECEKNVAMPDYFKHWEQHLVLHNVREIEESDKVKKDDVKNEYSLDKEMLATTLRALSRVDRDKEKRPSYRICTVCSRAFDRFNDCKRHLVEHLLKDAYSKKMYFGELRCQMCKAGFAKAEDYKQHMRQHGSLPVFKCEICNKTFSDSSNFGKHKKVHNMYTVVCAICEAKFQTKQMLIKHLEMHEEQGTIQCPQCPRAFSSTHLYSKHARAAHHPRAKYVCVLCGLRFDCLKDKWDHMWQVHKERQHHADCPICKKSFRKFTDVKYHVRAEHKLKLVRHTQGSKIVAE